VQSRSITRGFRATACVIALVAGVTAIVSRAQETPALAVPTPPPDSAARWREAPDYVALFVARPYRDAYRAFVSPLELDTALHTVATEAASIQAPGAWASHPESPLDVFGAGGTYDRWKLARLFGSHRPEVARGPRGHGGVVEESWTLVAPYPSPDLSRLEQGTLLIILRVP
jgi:hypothetical protein